MMSVPNNKIKSGHLNRKAFLYIRQSTLRQVYENNVSTKRQYALKERLIASGWDDSRIEVIDSDLGQSGADSEHRHGFQHLLSEVMMNRAGIVAGIEVSRLSRSSSDWNKLLQIAALSDTLIMDEDGLYNVNDFNDRLLLGLKGTLSEAELHYLKARMRGGLLNKAKRGELMFHLPPGYIYDENEQIVKDLDMQVQEAITLFFNTFKRAGSALETVRIYEKQGYLFPRRPRTISKPGELKWEKLTQSQAWRTVKNPIYAGIYAYGKKQIQHTASGRKIVAMPKEEYHAWLPNSHPSYISEAQYDENIKQLAKNVRPKQPYNNSGAIREGSALLQGIALCGNCGRRMRLRYTETKHSGYQPIYFCEYAYDSPIKTLCQRVRGDDIDTTIAALVLETINPMTVDAAISIQREMTDRKEEVIRLYSQQMERTRYEMDLAKRRYMRVDPDNRLVASELEHDWNQKISEYEAAKMVYTQKCESEVRAIDEKLQLALAQLVTDFPKVWNDPRTSYKEKKRIIGHVLEDVTITSDEARIVLGIRFKGGATKVIELPSLEQAKINTEQELLSVVKSMLYSGLTDREIVATINENGFAIKLGSKPFTENSIRNLVSENKLPNRRSIAKADGWLTAKEKAAELGIGKTKLANMRKAGELIYKECRINGNNFVYKPEEIPVKK